MNARDKISAARIRVWRRFPWFHALLFALRPTPSSMGSISVDEGLRLYYDPVMIDNVSVEELETLLAHEVQHPLRKHAPRERAADHLAGRYRRVWRECVRLYGALTFGHLCNLAGDCEINDDLILRVGMKMPEKYPGIMPATFKMPNGLAMEEYLHLMLTEAEKLAEQEEKNSGANGSPTDQAGAREAGAQGSGEEGKSEGEAGEGGAGDEAGESDAVPEDAGGGDGGDQGDGGSAQAPGDAPAQPREEADGAGGSGSGSGEAGSGIEPRCGHGACGGAAGQKLDHEAADGPDTPLAATPAELDRALRQVAHAVLESKGSNTRGSTPGGWLTEWAKSMLAPPKVNPYRVLAAATRSAIAGQQRGSMDFANGPQSRRRGVLTQYVGNRAPLMSVMRGPNPRVVFVVDTSGSMGGGKDSRLSHALAETMNIAKQCQATPLGLAVDAAVHEVRPVRSADDILKLARGGGGTDMRVGIREAADPKYRADVIVLLTDGETEWPTPREMPQKAALVTVIINRSTPKQVGCPPHILQSVVHVDADY